MSYIRWKKKYNRPIWKGCTIPYFCLNLIKLDELGKIHIDSIEFGTFMNSMSGFELMNNLMILLLQSAQLTVLSMQSLLIPTLYMQRVIHYSGIAF